LARLLPLLLPGTALAQPVAVNVAQHLVFTGLRSVGAQGQVNAVATDAAGDVYLAFNQGDGVRVLKVANDGGALLAQVQLGAAGDVAVALALDASGNVYVAGTSTSGALTGTKGAAMGSATAGTTNSFVAKFDAGLNEEVLTFTGGTQIAASAVAANSDAVFVTGIAYGSDLPVTGTAIEQGPAYDSMQNGFVEKFSADGTTLEYATYLTGALGDLTPTGIAVDAGDDAWIAGSTSASGFATVNAVVPVMLGSPSGFLMQLTPAGDGIVWATFVPGAGLTGLALDSTGGTLLATGAVDLGQFPVDTVTSVLVPTTYQVLLRVSTDGSTVKSGTVIAPGLASAVTSANGGAAWVGGSFAAATAPLLPRAALATIGTGYAVRFTPGAGVDETVRFGGLADEQQTYASIPVTLSGLAVDASGEVLVGGAAQPTASANLLGTETYDLPLRGGSTAALPSAVTDAEDASGSCGGSLCAGSAGYLAKVGVGTATPALTFSTGDMPFVVLRNLGSATANGLQVTASAGTLATNCGSSLAAGAECDGLLSGGGAGTLTALAGNAATEAVGFGAYTAAASGIVFYPKELDFGVQSSVSAAAVQTIAVTNLGTESETFASGIAVAPKSSTPFSQSSTSCVLAASGDRFVLAAGATCQISVAFAAAADAESDGFVQGEWSIGARQVLLTGYGQAAALSVSASEVDFGTEFQGGLLLPRYLYLSNASTGAVSHAALSLPAASPFTVTDGCPATLAAQSVCRIRLDYVSATAPSTDSVTLTLDQGLSVLLTGVTMPATILGGSTVNPNLALSPMSAAFADAVVLTGVSGSTQTIGVTNAGASPFSLSIALAGDFTDTTSCGATLAAGATCAVAIQFAPSQPGLRQGLLTVTAGGGGPVEVALSGTGTAILASNNGTLSFGGVPVGQPQVQWYKLTQPFDALTVGVTGPFRVTLAEDVGYGHGAPPSSSYVTSGTGTCHDCWVGVWFQPTAEGAQNGTLTFTSNPAGSAYVLQLTGSGVATTGLIVSPSVEDFGAIPVNSGSGLVQFTLTNLVASGNAVTISQPSATGDFAVGAASGGTACADSLAYGASCVTQVGFAPLTTGALTGMLTLATSAGNVTVPISGVGTADPGIGILPLVLTFLNDGAADSTVQPVTVTNTGSSAVQVGTPSTATASFSSATNCASLGAGASCSVQVSYAAGASQATDTLSIPLTSAGSGGVAQTASYAVALTGAYTSASAGLVVEPVAASYGPEATLTEGAVRVFSVSNTTASTLALTMSLPRDFALVGSPCGALAAGASCSFEVQFVPLTNGDLPGTITVKGAPSDGSATLTSLIYPEGFGVGTGALTITGGLLVSGVYAFGTVAAGQSASQVFTLANDGVAGSPTITVRRVTSAPPFLSATTCGAAMQVGQSCTVTVTYTPDGAASGAVSQDVGTLTIESDAQSGPDVINLTGQPGTTGAQGAAPVATFTLSQGSLSFAATPVGDSSAMQNVVLTNSGTVPIQVTSVTVPADFAVQNGCTSVAAGATCSFQVTSTPKSTGVLLEALSIYSTAATSLEFVSLVGAGQPSPLTLAPGALNFGSVQVGATAVLPVTVTNTGTVTVAFASVTASGDFSAGGNCPTGVGNLAPQASCTIEVTFAPTTVGALTGTLALSTSASSNPLTVPLMGIGTQSKLTVTPSSLAFGSIALGSTANLSLVLANKGTAPVIGLALSVIGTAAGDFAVTVPCPQATLVPGASCTVTLAFSPSSAGARSAALSIVSSDPSSPAAVPLTGTGVANASFTLTVNGGASASVQVVSGGLATYGLLATPSGGFGGSVALTCNPLQTTKYASCSLLPATVTLTSGPGSSTVTINTIEAGSAALNGSGGADRRFLALLLPGLLLLFRRGRSLRRRIGRGLVVGVILCILLSSGCGGNGGSGKGGIPTNDTPPGTYQFTVTANSTSGVAITQKVNLTLVVTAN
jgi:hypothetical protein